MYIYIYIYIETLAICKQYEANN